MTVVVARGRDMALMTKLIVKPLSGKEFGLEFAWAEDAKFYGGQAMPRVLVTEMRHERHRIGVLSPGCCLRHVSCPGDLNGRLSAAAAVRQGCLVGNLFPCFVGRL